MEMALEPEQVEKLLKHKGKYPIKRFGLMMTVTRMRGLYSVTPVAHTVTRCADELNEILKRHADIMEEDYLWISSL